MRLFRSLLWLAPFVALQLAASACGGARLAHAQAGLPTAVAVVVDYQRILRDAKAAQAIRTQIDARRKALQDQFAKEEKRLFDADKELAKQRGVLSPEAFAEKRKAFEEDVVRVQRQAQQRRRQLDQVATIALGEVRNAMVEIVGALAEQRKFNLVLPSSAVLLFSPSIDLTDEVMMQLDKRLPTVKVPEKPPEPAKKN
jgi:Skp family chaperone for outer membrane proteins